MPKRRNTPIKREMPLWWKYAVTYLLVLVVPFLAFNAYFNYYVTGEAEKDTKEAMQSALNKIQMDFDQKVEQMTAIGIQIGQNRDFRATSLQDFKFEARNGVRAALRVFANVSVFYDEIIYYHTVLPEMVFTTLGTYNISSYRAFLDEKTGEWIDLKEMTEQGIQAGWISPDRIGPGKIGFPPALFYCQPLEEIRDGYLFFEMKEASIRRLLTVDNDSEIYILQGNRLLYPFSGEIPQNLQPGKAPVKLGDGRYQCALTSSATGLTYVYIAKSSDIGEIAHTVLSSFMILSVLISLGCFAAVVVFSRRHARPIEQLVSLTEGIVPDDVRGVARLQNAMYQLRTRSQELDEMRQCSMRGHVLIRLVRGKYRSEEEAEENLRRLDITFRRPWRVIMLLQRDQEWDEKQDVDLVLGWLGRRHDIYSFAYAERSVYVMMLDLETPDRSALVAELEDLISQDKLKELRLHFAIGGVFTALTAAQESFMQALSSSRRNPGVGVSLFQETEENELFYPREELHALGVALAEQDRNRTAFLYDILLNLIQRHNHLYFYTVSLASEMINLYLQALVMDTSEIARGYAAQLKGQHINDVDDMLATLRQLHARALQLMTESDLSSTTTEMTGIANYISACDDLENLNVGAVAERFGLNVSSLSHKFKEQMGCNISDYILTCKMNHSCTLLRSTEETVADIAQKVGYSQYTSFVRTFKRLKGMTPTAYREAWRQGNNPDLM